MYARLTVEDAATRAEGPLLFLRRTVDVGLQEAVEVEGADGRRRLGRVAALDEDSVTVEVLDNTAGLALLGTRVRFLGQPLQLALLVDVDNEVLPDPSVAPYGEAATLVGVCDGREYRVPVSFHQHSLIALTTTAPIHMVIVEDHVTRKIHYADLYNGPIRVPPGSFDVLVSFQPFYSFVLRENVLAV